MNRSRSYKESLLESLADAKDASAYLNAALLDDDPEAFLLALRDVAEARGGVADLAKRTKLNRENLYRMLSKRGNPKLQSLSQLLDALGLRLSVESKPGRKSKKAS